MAPKRKPDSQAPSAAPAKKKPNRRRKIRYSVRKKTSKNSSSVSPRVKKAKNEEKEDKTPTKEVDVVVVEAVKDKSGSVRLVIEHCKQCTSFKNQAAVFQKSLKDKIQDIEISINPAKPRRGCFEVRDEEGNLFVSLLVTQPWVKVLRLVDGDLLPMGYLYEAMDRANGAILRMYARNRNKLDPLESIINRRWTHQLHRPLHAAGYYFNPKFFYDDNFEADDEVMDGLYTCIDRMIPDDNLKGLCPDEIQAYKRADGRVLSSVICKMSRRTLRPDLWWEDNGARCPNLQRMAVRILSQPCSASGCERNWSMFESIHTKRRNRLSQQRLNDLVFVQYNLRLHVRQVEGTDCYDAIDLDSMDPLVEWVAEDEEPIFTDEDIERLEREAAVEAEGPSRAHDGASTSRAAVAVYMEDEDEDEDEDDDEDEYIPEPEYPIRDEDVPVPLPSPPHVVRSEPMTYKRARGKRPLH